MTDFSILLIFKNKHYKNTNTANFVYYGKTLTVEQENDMWSRQILGSPNPKPPEFSCNTQSWQRCLSICAKPPSVN